jgi:hypothetical protein
MAGAAVGDSLTDDINLARQLEEMRAANQRLQRANSRLKEKSADLVDAVYQAARDAAVAVGKPAALPRPPRDRRRSPEVALVHTTDWQLGKQTETYNTEVCKQRVRTMVQKTIKLTEIQRADHPVRDCVLMLGGDHVEGITVFPGQAYEVDSNAFTQVFEAAALIEQTIITLLANFEHVAVHSVPGNHGRIGRKGDVPREDNLDSIVYRIVNERLKDPRLTWDLGEGFYRIVEIGAYRAMLVHGDQVKSFGGNVPAHGVLRKANSWSAGGIPEQFSELWLGHMHQPMTLQMAGGGLVRMTPSTESGSAYAREFMAAHGRPGQRLAFVSPSRGIVTAEYLIWLDD